MKPLTLFTWGYWGWGRATEKLIEAVDAVEEARGFEPPMFVDIRLSRSVRAPGFDGATFEHTLGSSRYRWLPSLGNAAIKEGGAMRIKDPAAAETLLDIAEQCAGSEQRVLFFCACEFPGLEHENGCHRVAVARLVLEAAQRRKTRIEIVEWPGGEPRMKDLEVQLPGPTFEKFDKGGATIPLTEPVPLAEMAAIPWCSPVIVLNKDDDHAPYFHLLTGPAKYKRGGWCLPVYQEIEPETTADQIRELVKETRTITGLTARQA